MDSVIDCPKCNSQMDEGFLLEYKSIHIKTITHWVEGIPETSIWDGLKTDDKRHFEVQTYRCTNCGYLESYAQEN